LGIYSRDDLGHVHPIVLAIGSCGSSIAKFLEVLKERLGQELNEQWVPTMMIDHSISKCYSTSRWTWLKGSVNSDISVRVIFTKSHLSGI